MNNPTIGDLIYINYDSIAMRGFPRLARRRKNYVIGLVVGKSDTSDIIMWNVYIYGTVSQCYLNGSWYHLLESELP